jgi:prevent-host-death family protein
MAYTVHQAKTHFSRLLKEAEAGQEVIVMRGTKPVAKLVPIEPPKPKGIILGGFEFLPDPDPHVFDPLTDGQMIEYGFGWMLPDSKDALDQNSAEPEEQPAAELLK